MIDNDQKTPPAPNPDLDFEEEIREPAEEAAREEPPAVAPTRRRRSRTWWQRFRRYQKTGRKPLYTPIESISNAGRFWLQPGALINLAVFALLVGYFIIQASVHWVAVIDDSYITFRFVDMFVQGHGWRFSPGGPRVEGFTNFLWAVSLIIPHMLHWDLMFVAKVFGMICGVATMAASWGLARSIRNREDIFNLIPAALLATNSYFSSWAMMGMETLLQTALVTACYWRFEAERRDMRLWQLSPLIAVLAAMTRIDSLYYLSPLGVYGLWLVLTKEITFRRMLTWGLLAAIPFSIYWLWKMTYFGDLLPNTYYAKQRLVTGHTRGIAHLDVFYLGQGDFDYGKPAQLARINEASANAWAQQVERRLWDATFAEKPSWIWMNFWLISAVLCVLSCFLIWPIKWIKKAMGKRNAFLRDIHVSKISFLILLPWVMNLYYLYHVDGDWMPCFRFMMVVLPFIGVAGAVGFGYVPQLIDAATGRRWLARLAGLGTAAVAGYLLLGTAVEQARIKSVSVYGPTSIYWASRQNLWWIPDRVEQEYSKGFSPPLKDVSDYLLLETQDDSWIFMSDIGQPLWFASHLNLYDVDGLTDPYLAHAPSVRGRLKTVDEYYQDILRERRIENPTPEQEEEIMRAAERRDFDAHIKRNANMIMDSRRPEYLLIFLNHSRPDPNTTGYPYPEISGAVYNHPGMKNYEEDAALPKIGNVFNHIYRRQDVPREVPNSVKIDRLIKTIERNPRMPYVVGLLYEKSLEMNNLSEEQQAQIDAIVLDAMNRWTGDPVVSQIARSARRAGKGAIAEDALIKAIERTPGNSSNYWNLSTIYEQAGEFQKAADVLWRAEQRTGDANSNNILYHLIWLSEQAGNLDGARKAGDLAIKRNPHDARAWSDYAAMLDRVSRKPGLDDREALSIKKESVEKFEKYMEELGKKPPHVEATVNRLRKEISTLEQKLNINGNRRPPGSELRPEEMSLIVPETRYRPTRTESRYR